MTGENGFIMIFPKQFQHINKAPSYSVRTYTFVISLMYDQAKKLLRICYLLKIY